MQNLPNFIDSDIMDELEGQVGQLKRKNEQVLFAGRILKMSTYYWKQERKLVVTEQQVFFFKVKELRKKIKIKNL